MNRTRRIALLFAVLFCLSAVAFVAAAKYVKDVPFNGAVTFTADLAENFTLTESPAVRNTDGTYSLSGGAISENTYVLMPGVDVPKDPKITITGKTVIPAYLYVEVKSTLPEGVTYTMAEGWTDLGITGPNGGEVYVYDTVLDGTAADPTIISILDGDTLKVSQTLLRETVATMTFHAYMAQQGTYATAKAAFIANFPTP